MNYENIEENKQMLCLNINSVCVLILVFMIILRYNFYISLLKYQLKLKQNDSLYNSGKFGWMLLEILAVLPHPNIMFHNVEFESYNYENQIVIMYSCNDILTAFSLLRLFPSMKWLLFMSSFYSNRSNHICQIHGFENGFIFVMTAL